MLGKHPRDRLLIHLVGDADDVDLHELGDELLGIGGEHVAERHHAEQALIGIEDVGGVDRLDLVAGLALQVADRLARGHVRAEARIARAHQTAGFVLGVREERGDLLAGRRIEQREQHSPLVLGNLLDHVGDVVGLEQAHPLPALAGAEVQEEGGLIAGVEPDEEVLGVLARQHTQTIGALLEIEQWPGIAQLLGGQLLVGRRGRRRLLRHERHRREHRGPLRAPRWLERLDQLDDLGVLAAALGDRLDLRSDLLCLLGRQRRDLAGGVRVPIRERLGDTVVGRHHLSPPCPIGAGEVKILDPFYVGEASARSRKASRDPAGTDSHSI